MIQKIILVLILMLSLVVSATAVDEIYNINVIDKNAVITHTILMDDSGSNLTLDLNIPEGSMGVSLNVDGEFVDITGDSYELSDVDKFITIEYVTEEIVSNSEVIFDLMNIKSDSLKVTVILDQNSVLKYAVGKGAITTSIYPSGYSISSNGRNIIISWKNEFVEEGDFSGLILLEKKSPNYLMLILTIIAVILLVFFSWNKLNEKKNKRSEPKEPVVSKSKVVRKKVTRKLSPQKKSDSKSILEHLKDDEAQVVRILKNKEGSAEQGTIRVIGDFSKATLSRILSELEQRKIIYKEKKGKKNIVHLKSN